MVRIHASPVSAFMEHVPAFRNRPSVDRPRYSVRTGISGSLNAELPIAATSTNLPNPEVAGFGPLHLCFKPCSKSFLHAHGSVGHGLASPLPAIFPDTISWNCIIFAPGIWLRIEQLLCARATGPDLPWGRSRLESNILVQAR